MIIHMKKLCKIGSIIAVLAAVFGALYLIYEIVSPKVDCYRD